MAKYIGLISSDARGKVGGTVLSRSRSGTTLKARTAPKKPQSIAQRSQQATLANANLSWRSLDDDQRTTWSVFAASLSWTNSLGGTYSPTGQQLYTQAFCYAAYFNTKPPASFPTSYTAPTTLTEVFCGVFDGEMQLSFEYAGSDEFTYWLLFAGRWVHSSVNYTATRAKAYMQNATTSEVFNMGPEYTRRFGGLPPNLSYMPIRIVPISNTAFVSGTIFNSAVEVLYS